MRAVWKFPIAVEDRFAITMPINAEILSVQVQNGAPFLWALVAVNAPKAIRKFCLCGTGHNRDDLDRMEHVGTFQLNGGALVFHVFAEPAP